jgi:hypothetical protein
MFSSHLGLGLLNSPSGLDGIIGEAIIFEEKFISENKALPHHGSDSRVRFPIGACYNFTFACLSFRGYPMISSSGDSYAI